MAILLELHASGVRLLALTNWSAETFPIAEWRFDFLQCFEGAVVSGREGVMKPEAEIFRRLIERHRLEPSRARSSSTITSATSMRRSVPACVRCASPTRSGCART